MGDIILLYIVNEIEKMHSKGEYHKTIENLKKDFLEKLMN